MNSFSIFLPWTTPGPLGIVMAQDLHFGHLLAIVLIVVDVMIYYPF